MIKPFVFLLFVLSFMVLSMGIHHKLFPYKKISCTLQNISKLTHLTSVSYSLAYDETPFNTTYPEMQSLDRREFVYDK
ncbi:hypothetical protein MNB_SV-3-509 [hydrothermal vent metagenome]|uniref:Uncharacterized protein n=1 Tax=hydrothermal vent metagenome TaxID=652676 RepID=A0A1W1CDJ6_9ZZZZ